MIWTRQNVIVEATATAPTALVQTAHAPVRAIAADLPVAESVVNLGYARSLTL